MDAHRDLTRDRPQLAWLYSTQLFGMRLGLDRMRQLLEALGRPHENLRFIHVAGTNGKGSVCAFTESILRTAGYRTGLYTSPHLVDFNERIQIDRQPIPDAEVETGIRRIRRIVSSWSPQPTFFEIATALAMAYFEKQEIDWVVLETGMGGRLDATNVVTPAVSIITAIDMDHSRWLGNTLEKIAFEKAGIVKPGVPVVSYAQEAEVEAVLRQAAQARETSVQWIGAPIDTRVAHDRLGLRGAHQISNAALALAGVETALARTGFDHTLPDLLVNEALTRTHWPARFDARGPRLVIDGAHNPSAATQLARTWKEYFGDRKATVVTGIARDKDVDGILREVLPLAAEVYCVPIRSARSLPGPDLAKKIPGIAPGLPVNALDDFEELRGLILSAGGLAPLDHRDQGRHVLVTGSLFLAGHALQFLVEAGSPL